MNVPGGGNVFWPSDWAGRHTIISVDRKLFGIYLTGGFEIIPQIRVGGGLVYYYATEKLTVAKALPGGSDGLVTRGRLRRRGELGRLHRDPAVARRAVAHRRSTTSSRPS